LKAVASAPGKVTLFGEHAVVYGYPALVAAISKRVYASVELRSDNAVKISARDLRVPGIVITYVGDEIIFETDYGAVFPAVAYINKAIEVAAEYLGTKRGVNVEIRSEMPVGAGLGTSAAVAVSTIAAYSAANGHFLSREEIANLGWQVEKSVQGIASPMDTSIASYGGYLKVAYRGKEVERMQLDVRGSLPLVLGYVEREAKTKDMVQMVRERLERSPDLIGAVLQAIGMVAERAVAPLREGNYRELGELMNINHGLLEALGVSNRRLNELVYVARESGAYGAKMTGAGGGGCVIALAPERRELVETAMRLHGSHVMKVELGVEGVRVEQVT